MHMLHILHTVHTHPITPYAVHIYNRQHTDHTHMPQINDTHTHPTSGTFKASQRWCGSL